MYMAVKLIQPHNPGVACTLQLFSLTLG